MNPPDGAEGGSHSHFGLTLVSPTLKSVIQHFYKAAIAVMDA